MRIALVARGGFDRSGRERVVPALLWLVAALARRHDVQVFTLDQYAEACDYPLCGATVHNLGVPTARMTRLALWLRRLLTALRKAGPFDVLHGYMGVPAGLLAGLAGLRLGIPRVTTFDGNELVSLPEIAYGLSLPGRIQLGVAGRLAARLTVGTGYMERLARRRGLEPAVIPFGVDSSLFAPRPEPPSPPWRLLHVASLNAVKDQRTLLEAFRRVRAAEPAVQLDVLGVDTLGGAVQALCADLGLSSYVTFHGLRPVDELPSFYARAHLLVQSSRHEAAGVAVLEAAAVGRASVGTAVGHVADGAPSRAHAVPPGEPAALAEGVLGLLRASERRAAMAEAAQAWAREHDAEWTASRLTEVYSEITRAPAPRVARPGHGSR